VRRTVPVPTEASNPGLDGEVTILRWPADEALRQGLAALGRPRLLLVDAGTQPPEPLDHLEDWLRWPPDPTELLVRSRHLSRRVEPIPQPAPTLDDDGVLRLGGRWVAVSQAQTPVLRLLLDNLDRVVRFELLVDAYARAGGSSHPASVRTVLARIAARVRPIGLELVSIRQRGVLLRRTGSAGPRDPTA
jgi:hypothetical protein